MKRIKEINSSFDQIEKNLKELSEYFYNAKNNLIDDLIEMEMCSSLQHIDLENNQIKDEDNLFYISSLDKLKSINLKGNPLKTYFGSV